METQKAAFQIEGFYFDQVRINHSNQENTKLGIDFKPSGIFHTSASLYKLNLEFKAINKENDTENELVKLTMVALFKFENVTTKEEIPDYFYRNAIAIVFPYIRAFVSNITLQANSKVIILPTMNLSNLEKPLKENTVVAE